MKLPKLSSLLVRKPRKKLYATTTARRAVPIADHYGDEEPQTRLSSAFIVVLILHVVAVGGIYAFNSIKAHRKSQEAAASSVAPALTAATTTVAPLSRTTTPPPRTERPASAQPAVTPSTVLPAAPALAGSRTYRVASGDNLTKVASQYAVTVAEIEEANGLKKGAPLRVGQLLSIPKASVSAAKSTPAVTYVVAKDDNPASIARKLHVNYAELLKINNIDDPKKLQPGQKLKVPAAKKTN